MEILLALTILALLVSSMAVAFQASLRSCEENERIASATQTVRSILNRMTSHVRSAEAVNLEAGDNELIIVVPTTGPDEREVRYAYDASAHTLLYQERVNGVLTENQVLYGDTPGSAVTTFATSIETGEDWQGVTCAKSVTVYLAFTQDGRTTSVSASASPRRNQTY